mmetsp:Transcript_20232/g.43824  ORF Transcript_20232/g.43824 Transcript_20232/m.43824 type:complete len:251 (+) Transcript_20232:168-920(+)
MTAFRVTHAEVDACSVVDNGGGGEDGTGFLIRLLDPRLYVRCRDRDIDGGEGRLVAAAYLHGGVDRLRERGGALVLAQGLDVDLLAGGGATVGGLELKGVVAGHVEDDRGGEVCGDDDGGVCGGGGGVHGAMALHKPFGGAGRVKEGPFVGDDGAADAGGGGDRGWRHVCEVAPALVDRDPRVDGFPARLWGLTPQLAPAVDAKEGRGRQVEHGEDTALGKHGVAIRVVGRESDGRRCVLHKTICAERVC